MSPRTGGICGRLTEDLPSTRLQGGVGTEARVEGHGESDGPLLIDPRPQQSHLMAERSERKPLY